MLKSPGATILWQAIYWCLPFMWPSHSSSATWVNCRPRCLNISFSADTQHLGKGGLFLTLFLALLINCIKLYTGFSYQGVFLCYEEPAGFWWLALKQWLLIPGQMLAWAFLFQQTAFVTTSIGFCSPTPTFSFKLFAVGWLIKLFHCVVD